MPGLLDDPMMSFAMGLLEAGGSSPRPVTFGQALARGYGMAQESQDRLSKREMQALQMQHLRDAMEQEKLMRPLQMQQMQSAIDQQKMQAELGRNLPRLIESLRGGGSAPYQDQVTPEMVGSNGLPTLTAPQGAKFGSFQGSPEKYFSLAAAIQDPTEKRAAIEAGFRQWPELRPQMQSATNRDPSITLGTYGATMGAAGLKGSDSIMKLAEMMKPQSYSEGATVVNPVTGERETLPKLEVGMRANNGRVEMMPGMMEFLRNKTAATVDPIAAARLAYETGMGAGGGSGLDGQPGGDNLPKAIRDKIAEEKAKKENDLKVAAADELNTAVSSYPQLDNTVKQLKEIGKNATYTMAGQARDAIARQFGTATQGAIAREKYVQTVRDVLFPQLRATFGAQFTVREGEALVATLGDPNKTPEERNAALDSFIDQKKQTIESKRRQVGGHTRQVVRTGTYGGRKVVEYSDGSVSYAD